MGMPEDEVRPVVLKTAPPAPVRRSERFPTFERSEGPKVVVVERKRPRLAIPR
jgi:hypothetical protein